MMSSFAGSFNSEYNSYESQPTFDDIVSESADSCETPVPLALQENRSPNNIFYTATASPEPIPTNYSTFDSTPPPLSQTHSFSFNTHPTMPLYTDDQKNDNKMDNTTSTLKKVIALKEIFQGPKQPTKAQKLFSDILCGPYVFDIGFYVKSKFGDDDSDNSDNTLVIVLHKKSKSRGTKRKAVQSADANLSKKKRRLNNSQSQTYSIGSNGHHSRNQINDNNQIISDNFELLFTVHMQSNNNQHLFKKKYKCKFGDSVADSPDLNDLNDWDNDNDSDCEQYADTCAVKTETLQELTNKFTNSISSNSSDTKIPKKQALRVWCELEIENVNENDNNNKFDDSNRIYKRHEFKKRKVTKFVGLKNEGATCYMNSMLQTLYHIAALRRNVYKIPVGHEAEQKKKKAKADRDKLRQQTEKKDTSAMDVCDETDDNNTNVSDDDDDISNTQIKNIKPPISLELQRLFYQLQTGAESNHQNEYELNGMNRSKKNNTMVEDDGNLSDCSIFTLKTDPKFANGNKVNGNTMDDDDVDMEMDANNNNNNNNNNMNMNMADQSSDDTNSYNMTYWQSSYDKAVSTEKLIKSFGWSGSDAFVQHDVQEFLRVLMDKIEAKVKCTPAEKIVEKLFSGEYQSYVSCKNVEYESVRNENFQDIQLTIPKNTNNYKRNQSRWNRTSSYSSYNNALSSAPDIYDCIRKFIQPETLDGNNQYYANDELKKQDADKGLRFKRFPPVLFLQLCRFEIDHYQHTSKINDPVKFYQDIDLNPFVYVETKGNKDGEDSKEENKKSEQEISDVEYNREAPNTYYNHLPMDLDGCGGFSYQLFSVLVHSGSTYGGHYFAYINPSGNKWYKFDDENVSVVDSDEATIKQFGGTSRQSAYMLVYIQKKYAKQILQEVNEQNIPFELRKYFSAEKEKARQKRREQIENSKKCQISYMNGHDIIYCDGDGDRDIKDDDKNNHDDEACVNVLDMGMKNLLTTKQIYKDIQFKQICKDWADETGIPVEYLMVWNYTERKNKTLRANRLVKLDINEEYKNKNNSPQPSEDDIKRHKIKTNPTEKHVKSIYDRIGNIFEKKRMFILLDDRKITKFENKSVESSDGQFIIIALKYFDFFTQKLYFVDWLYIKQDTITFGDIAKHIEETLIVNTKDKRSYFDVLDNYLRKMNEYESKINKKYKKFIFFEEENVSRNKGSRDDTVCKVNRLKLENIVGTDYFFGDIFVFQLNPVHSYFKTLKPSTNKIDNIKEIVNNNNNNGNNSKLSLKIKMIKHEFVERGEFWFPLFGKFIESQLNMTNIEIKVRENTGWKALWSKALLVQYKNNNNISDDEVIDKETRKKIVKSKHKWCVDKRSTYGMIRRKLGYYYNINPKHIEIWLPQTTYSYSDKWDYGSKGRGTWDRKLEKLLSSGRIEWNEVCNLKFEIQTYNVCDFDEMTLYDESNSSYPYQKKQFSKRIKELAMFNFDIIAPNKHSSNSGNMTMACCKNWTAKTLATNILKEVIENPIFGYTFFGNIVKYVRENEIDDNSAYVDDITILKSLTADRFLICDENDNKLPTLYYMNKQYRMPEHFSQIKYTDFRVQFLAQNDPLVVKFKNNKNNVINSEQQQEQQTESKTDFADGNDNEMEIDSDNKCNNKQIQLPTKALWVFTRKYSSYGTTKIHAQIRIVIQKGESLKDVVIKYLKSYLRIPNNTSKQSSVETNENENISQQKEQEDKENENGNEKKNENDTLFDQIYKTHKFLLKGADNKNISQTVMENNAIFDELTDKMFLIIGIPTAKKKYISSYDRPLTIKD